MYLNLRVSSIYLDGSTTVEININKERRTQNQSRKHTKLRIKKTRFAYPQCRTQQPVQSLFTRSSHNRAHLSTSVPKFEELISKTSLVRKLSKHLNLSGLTPQQKPTLKPLSTLSTKTKSYSSRTSNHYPQKPNTNSLVSLTPQRQVTATAKPLMQSVQSCTQTSRQSLTSRKSKSSATDPSLNSKDSRTSL